MNKCCNECEFFKTSLEKELFLGDVRRYYCSKFCIDLAYDYNVVYKNKTDMFDQDEYSALKCSDCVNNVKPPIKIGDRVKKTAGDYCFDGEVVSIFEKKSGLTRVVVEDARGLLFIFNPSQLEVVS